jgi:hypothetical protein
MLQHRIRKTDRASRKLKRDKDEECEREVVVLHGTTYGDMTQRTEGPKDRRTVRPSYFQSNMAYRLASTHVRG